LGAYFDRHFRHEGVVIRDEDSGAVAAVNDDMPADLEEIRDAALLRSSDPSRYGGDSALGSANRFSLGVGGHAVSLEPIS
jgi:hypothetical protein